MLDYRYVVRAAARDMDLSSYVPFKDWMDYPIMAALSCRGCTQSCVICGGSARGVQADARPRQAGVPQPGDAGRGRAPDLRR